MGLRSFVSGPVVLLLSAFLYYRLPLLTTLYHNSPTRLAKVNELGTHEVRWKDVVRNCEDIYLNEANSWALLSCDPGRDEWNTVMGTFVNNASHPATGLYVYDYFNGTTNPLRKVTLQSFDRTNHDFHPLGIDYHAWSGTLFIANHASNNSKIDVYKLDLELPMGIQIASLEHPLLPTPNSIAAINDKEFFVTNDHYFRARDNIPLAKLETLAGAPGGAVVYVKLSDESGYNAAYDWVDKGASIVKTLAWIPFANGIVHLNATTLAVASSATATVWLYHIGAASNATDNAPELSLLKKISVPFIPDNLSVDSNGKLLIAGHPHAPSLEKVSKNNRFCHGSNADPKKCQLDRLSWIAEWSEQTGLKNLYVGDEYGTACTAVRDTSKNVGFAVGLYEEGVLTWKS